MNDDNVFQFPPGYCAGDLAWPGGRASAEGVIRIPSHLPVTFRPIPSVAVRRQEGWEPWFEQEGKDGQPLRVEWLTLEQALDTSRFGKLTGIDLNSGSTDRQVRAIVSSFPDLEIVTLENTSITRRGLNTLASLRNLNTLHIYDASGLDFGACMALSGASKLKDLRLSLLADAGPGLGALAGLPALRALDLRHNRLLNDEHLAEIVQVPQLENVNLAHCAGLRRGALRTLRAMPSLRRVDLTAVKIPAREISDYQRELKRVRVATESPVVKHPRTVKPPTPTEAQVEQRRLNDAVTRKEVERHAVERAIEHLRTLGCTSIKDVGATKSWDLECSFQSETWRIEVKGTTERLGPITLTANEVEHARSALASTARFKLGLFICSSIKVHSAPAHGPAASGGTPTWIFPWRIDEALLRATQYSYTASQAARRSETGITRR